MYLYPIPSISRIMTTFCIITAAVLLVTSIIFLTLWLRTRMSLVRAEVENSELHKAVEAESIRVREKAESDHRDREQMQEAFRAEFQLLASKIFDEKTQKFKDTNRESIDTLLKPFKDDIAAFRKRVNEIYDEENRQKASLKTELDHLKELNRRITQETTNLTNALKGSSKVQGDWGEMILEKMLESSNLQKGIHYFVQENIKGTDGNDRRPDVILKLPEGKSIIIDSKVSLTAYVQYTETEDETTRDSHLLKHVASIRKHMDDLHKRNYQGMVSESPDFVIMFVPNEPAFMSALQANKTLWNEAYNKKIIISSPTNLFALLKIVDDLWKRDKQSRNYEDIAKQGGVLHSKFVGFIENFKKIGNSLNSAQKSYDDAWGQLSEGRGNLINSSKKLEELGVKATKKLPTGMLNDASDDDQ